jgi:hypothetical protein
MFVAVMMWWTTRDYTQITKDIFRFSNRPYVGIVDVTAEEDAKNKNLSVHIELKNAGSVPARDLHASYTLSIKGNSVGAWDGSGTEFAVFPPQMSGYIEGKVAGNAYSSAIIGNPPLEVDVELKYKGMTEDQYYYRLKARYDANRNTFSFVRAEAQ